VIAVEVVIAPAPRPVGSEIVIGLKAVVTVVAPLGRVDVTEPEFDETLYHRTFASVGTVKLVVG
jgi:hypothetical protein